ncbi:MAG: type II toxin-antitoxin system RatA family toxin [Devosia sp.]|jgi:coenzyme Q-binding protein COQ10|uniref:type II toxin-antitoxin system RatA family toxin n=1 Tax=unclassified Devosia TaxID=196773 RepID=UPI0019F89E45|nr:MULTISPECIES: type II toxin-antitoxin system RatA family toxin [unclassified Devosia]MBF0678309.1 type II toxin-antitoxin system RatA family toxin [Devosia sp.]WEJ31563.1 type II toxin-antitoxin system RatA family toxin [Devosia sp. SD17-2]
MKRFFERHVPHLPQRMYDIVADLEDYPRFIPNCRAMEVRPDPAANGADVQLARMTLYFGPITQAYTSRVTRDAQALTIRAKAVDGPFAYLDSVWSFEPEGMGTRVRFEIDFKISNPFIAAVAEPAFAAKQEEIMRAFSDEADRRFGS